MEQDLTKSQGISEANKMKQQQESAFVSSFGIKYMGKES